MLGFSTGLPSSSLITNDIFDKPPSASVLQMPSLVSIAPNLVNTSSLEQYTVRSPAPAEDFPELSAYLERRSNEIDATLDIFELLARPSNIPSGTLSAHSGPESYEENVSTGYITSEIASLGRRYNQNEEEACLKHLFSLKSTYGNGSIQTAPVLGTLAHICYEQGRFTRAKDWTQQAISAYGRDTGYPTLVIFALYNHLYRILTATGSLAEAEQGCGRQIQHMQELRLTENVAYVGLLNTRLNIILIQHPRLLTLEMVQQVNRSTLRICGTSSSSSLDHFLVQAACLSQLSQLPRALGLYWLIENELAKRGEPKTNQARVAAQIGRMKVEIELGQVPQTDQMHIDLVALCIQDIGREHILTLVVIESLIELWAMQGRIVEAQALCKAQLQIMSEVLGAAHRHTIETERRLDNLTKALVQSTQ